MPATLVLGDLGTEILAQVRVGADWGPFVVHLVDGDGTPIDLTGSTMGGEIKKTYKDTIPKAAVEVVVTDAVNGHFTFGVPRSVTRTLNFGTDVKDDAGAYVWYVWMRDTTGREFPIYAGKFVVVWGSKAT